MSPIGRADFTRMLNTAICIQSKVHSQKDRLRSKLRVQAYVLTHRHTHP